jgi:iron-sulfur cluster assembly accessory protein
MLQVTEKALEKAKEIARGQEGAKAVRILMTEGGWRGPYLVLAFDEQHETDEVFTRGGLTFLVDKTLLGQVQPITVDYVEGAMGMGFTLKSELFKDMTTTCGSIWDSCESCPP